jgi:anti-anti-sigma regulatory factor
VELLRIHIEEKCNCARLRLEGKLAGAWVEELERCCQDALARSQNRALVIELDAVTFVDDEGQSLLLQMHQAGATLVGRGAQCRHLVEQIQQQRTG